MKQVIWLTGICICLFSGCLETVNNYNEVAQEIEYSLKLGDSISVEQQDIFIKFEDVKDESRCPIGAVCIWEGNATVVLQLKNSQGETLTANLNTSIDPKEVKFSQLTIGLKELDPYPILDTIINPKDYIATLLVKK